MFGTMEPLPGIACWDQDCDCREGDVGWEVCAQGLWGPCNWKCSGQRETRSGEVSTLREGAAVLGGLPGAVPRGQWCDHM